MFKRLTLLFLFVFLAGCVHRAQTLPTCVGDKTYTQQTRRVGAFNRVFIDENINVSLHSGYSKPKVILKGAKCDLTSVYTINSNGELRIEVGEGYPKCGPLTAIIQAGKLNRFEYHGVGTIKGTKLNTPYIDLILDNQGSTTLGGTIGVRTLEISGSGPVVITGVKSHNMMLSLSGEANLQMQGKGNVSSLVMKDKAHMKFYWVDSRNLKIRAYDKTYIQLAGIVDKLDVKLCDKAHFNGRYLRANRAFVKTFGHSLAEISAVNRQHTLASDSSDIHFYNLPVMRTDFLAFDGAVLDMRDLRLPEIQPYDRYNKYTQM